MIIILIFTKYKYARRLYNNDNICVHTIREKSVDNIILYILLSNNIDGFLVEKLKNSDVITKNVKF